MSQRQVAGQPGRQTDRLGSSSTEQHQQTRAAKRRLLNDKSVKEPAHYALDAGGDDEEGGNEDDDGDDDDGVRMHKLVNGKARAGSSPSPSHLPVLPTDVWKRIFDIYYDRAGRDWDRTGRRVGWMAPLLVSSDMCALALPTLYEHPHLSHDSLSCFARCAKLPARVAPGSKVALVRHLTICPCPLALLGQTDQATSLRLPLSRSLLQTCRLFRQRTLPSLTIKNIWVRGWKEAELLFESLRQVRPRKARLEIQSWHPAWVPPYNPQVVSQIQSVITRSRINQGKGPCTRMPMVMPGEAEQGDEDEDDLLLLHPRPLLHPPRARPSHLADLEVFFKSRPFLSTLLLFFLQNVPFGTEAYWQALESRVHLLGTDRGSVPPELEGILETRTRFQKWATKHRVPAVQLEPLQSRYQSRLFGDNAFAGPSGATQDQEQTMPSDETADDFIRRRLSLAELPVSSRTAFDLEYASCVPPHRAVIPTLRWRLHAILTQYWSQTLEAFSLVIADKLGTSLVLTDNLDFWPSVAVPHIRLNLPEHPLVIFQDQSMQHLRGRQQTIGGDGTGGGLLHRDVRIFEFELNSAQDFEDPVWTTCGGQLPPQVCRILKGDQDWRYVVPGSPISDHDVEAVVARSPSPSESDFASPTFSFASLADEDAAEEAEMGQQDQGQWYDAEAARVQREKLAARKS